MKKTFCDRCGAEIKDGQIYVFSVSGPERYKNIFTNNKNEVINTENEIEICKECERSLRHWIYEERDLPGWHLMQSVDDTIKGLEWILEGDRFGFGQNWDNIEEPETEEELAGYYIERALVKLKEIQSTEDDRK